MALATGCDQSTPAPPPPSTSTVHLVAANVSSSLQLPADGAIELAFDRLLLPSCITRQTFVLQQNTLTPTVAYDPVARVVTVKPTSPFTPGQFYTLAIASPQSPSDPNGLRAIDGATLDPSSTNVITFEAAPSSGPSPTAPTVDFCKDVFPVLAGCGGTTCHGTAVPAAGLLLTTATGIAQTAIGRVAHGANTGPRAAVQPPGLLFGEDMPIVDPGTGGTGNPGDSWLLYKLLMAVPQDDPTSSCDAGTEGGESSGEDAGGGGDARATLDGTVSGDATTSNDASASKDGAALEGGPSKDATASTDAAKGGSDATTHGTAGGEGGSAGDAEASTADASDGGAEESDAAPALTNVCSVYAVPWQPIAPSERDALASLIPGREMPYPSNVDAGTKAGLSVQTLERLSLWITEAAPIPANGCPSGL